MIQQAFRPITLNMAEACAPVTASSRMRGPSSRQSSAMRRSKPGDVALTTWAAHHRDRPEAFVTCGRNHELAELAGTGGEDEGLLTLFAHDVEHGERRQRVDDHARRILVAHARQQGIAGGRFGNRIAGPATPAR